MSQSRVFLADQSLTSFAGHCYAYFAPIRDVLERRGIQTTLVGHRTLTPELATAGVVPAFSLMSDERALAAGIGAAAGIRHQQESAMRSDLEELDDRFTFRTSDLIVINTIRHWPLRAFPRWLESLPEHRRPRIVLIFHYTSQPDPFQWDEAADLYREGFAEIERIGGGKNIALAADASTLVDEFSRTTRIPVLLAPFPHTDRPMRGPRNRTELFVCYAGEARRDKGFHLIPSIAEKMLRTELADTVQFHVQTSVGNPDQAFYRDAVRLLTRMPNVVTYPEAFEPSRYESFLGEADVLLIPYQRTFYHRQTSGIFAEARAMDVPVVVTRGTWMAKELTSGGGGALCRPDDPLSLFSATLEVCRHYAKYEIEAREAGTTWRRAHSPERFVEMLRVG